MRYILKLGAILMVYCLVAGSLLAFVQIKTAPIIKANKEAASGDVVRVQVLSGMDGGFVQNEEGSEFKYWTGYTDAAQTDPGGYIFIAYGEGYQSTVETMVGVDTDFTITGTKVLFQGETPGIGDGIVKLLPGMENPWVHQFVGKSASDKIALSDDDGVIDGISGATVTSLAVTKSIDLGLKNLQASLSGAELVVEEVEEDNMMDMLMGGGEEEEEKDNMMDQLMGGGGE
ncbi:FMN-binding protein [Candidatus Latescibacterota bacterium]